MLSLFLVRIFVSRYVSRYISRFFQALQKSINASIERELANKAGTRSLSVVRVESTDADASQKGSNKKVIPNKKT